VERIHDQVFNVGGMILGGFVTLKKILRFTDTRDGHGHVIFLENLVEKVNAKKIELSSIVSLIHITFRSER
jgi:hypothetical protein